MGHISIPFSTIKSLVVGADLSRFKIFQFHLVRLKAKEKVKKGDKNLFQFHLVRLKVFSGKGETAAVRHFNSI